MQVYDKDKLYEETRHIAARFRNTLGKNIGGITSELAAYDAARLLNLRLCDDSTLAYTAEGRDTRDGKKILVKGRAIFKDQKSRQRLGQLNLHTDWDLLLLVLFDDEFEAEEIYEASREEVIEALDGGKDRPNRKGTISVAKFKIIGRLAWTRQEGVIDDEIWDNRG